DTVPFVLIAFLGVMNPRDLLLMIAFQYFMKLGIEVFFGTPLAYATIHIFKRTLFKARADEKRDNMQNFL
ncbi:MAG: hypothetical protein IKY70_02440, partial [Bacteroidales bacterium]|nr:hypothetical protein [Bacteroidales bacterium]